MSLSNLGRDGPLFKNIASVANMMPLINSLSRHEPGPRGRDDIDELAPLSRSHIACHFESGCAVALVGGFETTVFIAC